MNLPTVRTIVKETTTIQKTNKPMADQSKICRNSLLGGLTNTAISAEK